MGKIRCYCFALFLIFSAFGHAGSADMSVNQNEVRIGVLFNNVASSEANFGGYFLSGEDNNKDFWLTFKTIPGNLNDTAWLFAASIDAYALHASDLNKIAGYGLAMGGSVGYRFLTSMPTNISFEMHFSPNVISFGDISSYYTLELRYEVFFTPSAIGYVAYRNHRASFSSDHEELPQKNTLDVTAAAFVGIKIRF